MVCGLPKEMGTDSASGCGTGNLKVEGLTQEESLRSWNGDP
jgi:hypothetical protein